MASTRFAFVLIASIIVFQVVTWTTDATAIRVARDVTTTPKSLASNAAQTIEEALESIKTGFNDLMKTVEDNELVQNVSAQLQKFGHSVQKQGQQLVEQLQNATKATPDKQ